MQLSRVPHLGSQIGEDEIYIVVGSNSLTGNSSFKKSYSVKKVFAHASFNKKIMNNDIGLIHLIEEIEFNGRIQPLKLPLKKDLDKANYTATLIGWGRIEVSMKIL